MISIPRRIAASIVAAVLTSMASATIVHAQAYPDKPVKVIVTTSAGGGVDALARLVSQELATLLKQPFIVENRADASGIVGAQFVAGSKPDGYTLMFNASTLVITPFLVPNMPFDAEKDFTPITEVAKSPFVVAIHPAVPANNMAELILYAKKAPNTLSFGVAGIGTPDHIAVEWFSQVAGIQSLVVPYKGGGPALQGILSGTVNAVMFPPILIGAQVQAGKVKALAVTSAQPTDAVPGVPTVASSVPGYEFASWYGFWGPKGMDPAHVQAIYGTTAKILAAAAFKEQLTKRGLIAVGSTPVDFAAFNKREMSRYGNLIRERNLGPK